MRPSRWLVAILALVVAAGATYLMLRKPAWDIASASNNLAVPGLADAELSRRGINRLEMGSVTLPTGRIVAADPLAQPDRRSFVRTVAPGRYPVTLFIAEERVVMAMLRLSDAPIARWELALVPGQSTSRLEPGTFFGYPVDTGLGSFMDAAAFAAVQRREAAIRKELGPQANYYDDVLHAELSDGRLHLLHRPMPDTEVDIAIFGSGWGDGSYPSIWGLSDKDVPVALVTDFHVLDDGKVPDR